MREYAARFDNWQGDFILSDSRVEGMEGRARTCDWRLRQYFPEKQWDFPVYDQKRYE